MRMVATMLLGFSLLLGYGTAADADDWIRYSAISPDGKQIAFCYKGDIYLVDSAGGEAQILTLHPASDFHPVWSRDGRHIAFASDRHGNLDVYVVAALGGEATRLTCHSSDETPYCFSGDDQKILFGACRGDSARHRQYPDRSFNELYSVPVSSGRVEQIWTIPSEAVQISRDGKLLLYHDIKGGENPWRKHHKSAVTRDIWCFDTLKSQHRLISAFTGEDRNPVFSPDGRGFYYLSEESGSFNVRYSDFADPGRSREITRFTVHPVRFLSIADNGTLCFTFNGAMYTQAGDNDPVEIPVEIIHASNRNDTQLISANGRISEMAVAPSGKEVALVVRGEVFAASVEGEWCKKITNTVSAEAFISFSPDGKSIVYASERNGRWGIYKSSRANEDEPYFFASTVLKEEPLLVNDQDNYQPKMSPDGTYLAYIENRNNLKLYDIVRKESRVLLDNGRLIYMSDGDQYFEWSPDSQWLTVEYSPAMSNPEVLLISVNADRKPVNLTESGYSDLAPRWVNEGKQIIWFSDRHGLRSYANSGSRQRDVYTMFMNRSAYERYLLTKEEFDLQKEIEDKAEEGKKSEDKDKKKKDADKEEKKAKKLEFDWTGLTDRKERLTIHSSYLSDAVLSKDGETLYYLGRFDDKADLWSTELRTKETKVAVKLGVRGGKLQWDNEMKTLFLLGDGRIFKLDPSKGSKEPVSIAGTIRIDENAERREMFEHVWHRTDNMFYSRGFHGIDWQAMYRNYSPKLASIGNDREFTELLSEMLGELNVSHCGARYRGQSEGGDETASLGLIQDYSYKGPGIKIAEILRNGPLDKSKFSVKKGMVIVKINGKAIGEEDWARHLNRIAGQHTALEILDPETEIRQSVTVKPISLTEENDLLYERWVRRNEDDVARLSQGRIGYVHIPGMNDGSYRHTYERAMGKYGDCEALIVDTRNNGGGDLVGDITMFLTGKKFITYATDSRDLGIEPNYRWIRPSVALVNEDNYSDGHCFACAYQELGIGKLIGMPVPGTCSFAGWEMLQNGSIVWGSIPVSARNLAGEWMENNETVPDIVIKNMPGEVDNGLDRQLEKAVAELLKTIDKG